MKTTAFALMTILALLALACGGGDDSGADDDGEPTAVAADCSTNLVSPAASGDLTWEAILPVPAPSAAGFTVDDAEGDAPIANVLKDGDAVGTIELLQFALEADFDTAQGINALVSWVERFYSSVEADRGVGEVNGIPRFQAFPPVPGPFGSFCGIGYAYTVLDETGATTNELFLGYATFDESKLYLATAFYDDAQPGFGFKDDFSAQEFASAFDDIVAALVVPAP